MYCFGELFIQRNRKEMEWLESLAVPSTHFRQSSFSYSEYWVSKVAVLLVVSMSCSMKLTFRSLHNQQQRFSQVSYSFFPKYSTLGQCDFFLSLVDSYRMQINVEWLPKMKIPFYYSQLIGSTSMTFPYESDVSQLVSIFERDLFVIFGRIERDIDRKMPSFLDTKLFLYLNSYRWKQYSLGSLLIHSYKTLFSFLPIWWLLSFTTFIIIFFSFQIPFQWKTLYYQLKPICSSLPQHVLDLFSIFHLFLTYVIWLIRNPCLSHPEFRYTLIMCFM